MHHDIGLIVAENTIQFGAIADIHLFKSETRIPATGASDIRLPA
jgi:hypothetical protein